MSYDEVYISIRENMVPWKLMWQIQPSNCELSRDISRQVGIKSGHNKNVAEIADSLQKRW